MKTENYKPEYGEKIRVNKKYKRRRLSGDRKAWEELDFNSCAIYLGTRTLVNGHIDWDYDSGYWFMPSDYFTAAVVSPGPNSNNVYVPLDAIDSIT